MTGACGKEHQAWMDQEGECLACEIATLKAERDRLKEAIKNALVGLACLERGRYLNGGPIRESMRPSFANSIAEDLRLALEGDRTETAKERKERVETEEACRLLNERDGFQPRRDPA